MEIMAAVLSFRPEGRELLTSITDVRLADLYTT